MRGLLAPRAGFWVCFLLETPNPGDLLVLFHPPKKPAPTLPRSPSRLQARTSHGARSPATRPPLPSASPMRAAAEQLSRRGRARSRERASRSPPPLPGGGTYRACGEEEEEEDEGKARRWGRRDGGSSCAPAAQRRSSVRAPAPPPAPHCRAPRARAPAASPAHAPPARREHARGRRPPRA